MLESSEIQKSKSKEVESEGDSSYDSDAPPAKRQRTCSSDTQQKTGCNKERESLIRRKDSLSYSQNVIVSCVSVVNGTCPPREASSATPTPPPVTDR